MNKFVYKYDVNTHSLLMRLTKFKINRTQQSLLLFSLNTEGEKNTSGWIVLAFSGSFSECLILVRVWVPQIKQKNKDKREIDQKEQPQTILYWFLLQHKSSPVPCTSKRFHYNLTDYNCSITLPRNFSMLKHPCKRLLCSRSLPRDFHFSRKTPRDFYCSSTQSRDFQFSKGIDGQIRQVYQIVYQVIKW